MSKSSSKTIELQAYRLDKDCPLSKEKLKSLAERLCGPLRLYMSSVDIQECNTKFLASGRDDNCFCVARTCQVSLKYSHLVDYKGNTAL